MTLAPPRTLLRLAFSWTLAAAFALPLTGCSQGGPERARCAQCGMYVDLAEGWNAGAVDANGSAVLFDSPKCLFRWMRGEHGRGAHDAWVTEYYAQERTPLDAVQFVVGSDRTSPMGADLVPVATGETVDRFVADHGGHPVTEAQVDAPLLRGLDAR